MCHVRAPDDPAGLEGRREEQCGKHHPGLPGIRCGQTDRGQPEETIPGVRASDHPGGHAGVGLVVREENVSTGKTRGTEGQRTPLSRAARLAPCDPYCVFPLFSEEVCPGGSHGEDLWQGLVPVHSGAVYMWGLAPRLLHRGAHPERREGTDQAAGDLW